MLKNVVIIGPPRCGKTTLAKKITKEFNNFSLISEDNFKSSFIATCEELEIYSINMAIPRRQCFNYLIQSMYYEDDINYVVDLLDYDDEILKKLKENSIIVFIGYSDLSSKELFDNIRKYDKSNDWTYIENDYWLTQYCECFMEQSKYLQNVAKENNYWYVDVSKDREEILSNTFEKIKEMLNEERK